MMEYRVIVSGYVYARCETREEAEKMLDEARHSYLAMVHPKDCFFIKEVEKA